MNDEPITERHLLAIDFANIAHRAYHRFAADGMTSPDGRPTGVAYGILMMTLGLIRRSGATHVAFAFESTAPSRRRERYPDYKAGRSEAPADMYAMFDVANVGIGHMGWARYRCQGYEGDDTLAALAAEARAAGFTRIDIATNDKDLFGCVDDVIRVLPLGGGLDDIIERAVTPDKLLAKYGVTPAQWRDYKALIGDPGDNYGGVPGIGPVAAARLLSNYSDIEGIIAHLDELKPGERTKLQAGREQLELCRYLATLCIDAPLTPAFDPAAGEIATADQARAAAYLRGMGMNSLLNRLPRAA